MGCASLENALKIVLLSVIMNSIQHCKSTWISQELINTSACSCLAPPSSLFLAISGCKCISLYILLQNIPINMPQHNKHSSRARVQTAIVLSIRLSCCSNQLETLVLSIQLTNQKITKSNQPRSLESNQCD